MSSSVHPRIAGGRGQWAHYPLPFAVQLSMAGCPLPSAPCSAAVCRSMPTAHCPLGSNKPEDTQRGSVQNGLHCPLPTAVWHSAEGFTLPMAPSGAAVYRNTNTAHYPLQCGSVLKDLHCPLPTTAGQCTQGATTAHCPPQGHSPRPMVHIKAHAGA